MGMNTRMEISSSNKIQATENNESLNSMRDTDLTIKTLGLTLVDQGKIKPSDINTILTHSQKHNLRFGEAAVQLGLIREYELNEVLAAHFNYPYIDRETNNVSNELVAAYAPFSRKGEALRALRSQLILSWFSEGRKSLAVVSPQPGSGSSYIAANLAIIWSQMGERTLLVDADLQHGRQHQLFNISNKVGLSSVLAGRGSASSIIKTVPPFRGLSLLPAGAPPPNPGELLQRNEFHRMAEDLLDDYSVVIYDTPSMNSTNGWEFVTARCTDALVVMRKNKTPLNAANKMIKKIQSLNAQIVGSVMTDF